MTNNPLLRFIISNDEKEVIVYSADNFSQFPTRNTSVSSKCDRALAAARSNDLVILRGKLDKEYQQWLSSHGLGTDYIVEYKQPETGHTLSELIVANPNPVKKMIQKLGGNPVYVPWYSTQQETIAANIIGAELFGAAESETLKYNDKATFKALCQKLDIPVVDGAVFSIQADDNDNFRQMEILINRYKANHDTVIIRGTLGETGASLYKTQGDNLASIYQTIVASHEKTVLIEPFLKVFSSPNDQWVIDRKGKIAHIGIVDQECRDGMHHVGSLKGLELAPGVYDTITQTSLKIVTNMAKSGYCGVIGIDYIVSDEGIFPVENNARFNGSSYVHITVHNIEEKIGAVPFWKFVKLNTQPCSFAALVQQLSTVIYDGKRANSIFPLNCDALLQTGAFSIVILAQDIQHIQSLENELETRYREPQLKLKNKMRVLLK